MLGLPLELQSQIYCYVVGGYYIRVSSDVGAAGTLKLPKSPSSQFFRHSAVDNSTPSIDLDHNSLESRRCRLETDILYVCKAISALTQSMLYAQNTFCFCTPFDLLLFIKHQTNMASSACNLQMIKTIELEASFLHPIMRESTAVASGTSQIPLQVSISKDLSFDVLLILRVDELRRHMTGLRSIAMRQSDPINDESQGASSGRTNSKAVSSPLRVIPFEISEGCIPKHTMAAPWLRPVAQYHCMNGASAMKA